MSERFDVRENAVAGEGIGEGALPGGWPVSLHFLVGVAHVFALENFGGGAGKHIYLSLL